MVSINDKSETLTNNNTSCNASQINSTAKKHTRLKSPENSFLYKNYQANFQQTNIFNANNYIKPRQQSLAPTPNPPSANGNNTNFSNKNHY
jgi:hypothetical protein